MNIVLTPTQFKTENVYFTEAIENTVMDDSKFIKIIYSTQFVILNGVFIEFKINITNKENYFKKIKYNFDVNSNNSILQSIFTIETDILNHYNSNKHNKHIIRDSLSSGIIKIFPNSDNELINSNGKFILKISGLWENIHECGLTYKLVSV